MRKEGRITVPKEVRDALGIEDGELVKCKVWERRCTKRVPGLEGWINLFSLSHGFPLMSPRQNRGKY